MVEYIDAVRNNKDFAEVDRTLGRLKSDMFDLKEECVGDVLGRMEVEADEFVEWDEILEYFTRRGRPQHFEDLKLSSVARVPKIASKAEEFD